MENKEKKKIYYSRTYRHLKIHVAGSVLYLCAVVLPVLILFVLNLNNITHLMSKCAVNILGKIYPGIPMYIREDTFSILGTMEFVEMPTVYPQIGFSILNFLVVLFLVIFCCTGSRKGRPVSIFMTIMFVIHIINCIYFIFAANYFPYTAFQYSNLYVKQQIGIWLTFIVMMGLVTALQGTKVLLYKVLAFFSVLAYSFLFGFVRYILFLYIIQEFSIIYMALMFFALGPFFDFLYLVGIYGFFMNKVINVYESAKGKGEWKWS